MYDFFKKSFFAAIICYNRYMKKFTKRWYEKDNYTRAFMNLFEDLPLERQCEIATEIIIKASSMIDRDYEKMIQEVSEYNPKEYKRWYDKNPSIHLAVESLRDLDDKQKEQLFYEIVNLLESEINFNIEYDLNVDL